MAKSSKKRQRTADEDEGHQDAAPAPVLKKSKLDRAEAGGEEVGAGVEVEQVSKSKKGKKDKKEKSEKKKKEKKDKKDKKDKRDNKSKKDEEEAVQTETAKPNDHDPASEPAADGGNSAEQPQDGPEPEAATANGASSSSSKKDKKKNNKKTTKGSGGDNNKQQTSEPQQDNDEQQQQPTNKKQKEKQKQPRFIVFVGNLPFSATAESVKRHFASLSPTSVRLLTSRDDPSRSRGIAFVEFSGYDRMRTCLAKFHHTEFDDGVSPPRRINVELTYVSLLSLSRTHLPSLFPHNSTPIQHLPTLPLALFSPSCTILAGL